MKPNAKGSPAATGSRTVSQRGGAAEGAAGSSVTTSRAESGRFVPTDETKKILEKYGNDPNKAIARVAELEGEYTRARQELSRMSSQLESLQGLSEFIDRDPVTGKAILKPELIENIRSGGGRAAQAEVEFKKQLSEKLLQKLQVKDSDPSQAFVDMAWEAAEFIAQQKVQGVRGSMETVSANSQLGLFLLDNPEYVPLGEHIKSWIAKQPQVVRDRVTMEEAALIVKNRLQKAGVLEGTGYKELSNEDRETIREKTSLTGSGSGSVKSKEDIEAEREEEDNKIKEGIRNAPGGYDAFLRNSRQRALGKEPKGAEADSA